MGRTGVADDEKMFIVVVLFGFHVHNTWRKNRKDGDRRVLWQRLLQAIITPCCYFVFCKVSKSYYYIKYGSASLVSLERAWIVIQFPAEILQ